VLLQTDAWFASAKLGFLPRGVGVAYVPSQTLVFWVSRR